MWKFLRILGWTVAIVAALIGVLRLTAIRWWQLPQNDPYLDASVAPSLHGGDWIVLWRATQPKFGDLVLCPEPKTNRPVIGRMVAEGSDHLKLSGSTFTLNTAPAQVEGSCDAFRSRDPASGVEGDQSCSLEVVNGRTHLRGNDPKSAPAGEKPPDPEYDIPNGQVFLLSDNRAFPYDSRDFGTVDRAQCVETVVFRLVSKDGFFDVANRLSLIH